MHVKHAVLGWISPTAYYAMQEFHRVLPEIVHGAYRLKQAIYGTELGVSILGSEVHLPAWVVFVGAGFIEAGVDTANGHPEYAVLDLLALGLPFGEIWTVLRAVQLDIGFMGWLDEKIRYGIGPQPSTGKGHWTTGPHGAPIWIPE